MKGFSKVKSKGMQRIVHKAQVYDPLAGKPLDEPAARFQRWDINIQTECRNHFLLYKFLKKNFGYPSYSMIPKINGKYTNIHYEKYGADKQQWGYEIQTPNGFLDIYDKERSYVLFFGYTEI